MSPSEIFPVIKAVVLWILPVSRYRRFFYKANCPMVIASRKGFFITVNAAFAEPLGYTHLELSGKKFMLYVHPEDVHKTIEAMETLREGGKIDGFTNRYKTKSGAYKNVVWTCIGNGRIYAVAVIENS